MTVSHDPAHDVDPTGHKSGLHLGNMSGNDIAALADGLASLLEADDSDGQPVTPDAFAEHMAQMLINDACDGCFPMPDLDLPVREFWYAINDYVDGNSYDMDVADELGVNLFPFDQEVSNFVATAQGLVQKYIKAKISTCVNPQHDHTTTYGDDYDTGAELPIYCKDCMKTVHYDKAVEDYRHDDPDVTCFLIQDNSGGSLCVGSN